MAILTHRLHGELLDLSVFEATQLRCSFRMAFENGRTREKRGQTLDDGCSKKPFEFFVINASVFGTNGTKELKGND